MSYVKTIKEDGVVSDIMAKALDPTLDATLLHKSELVNGFTQTTAGVNALDAAAGKSLNDSLENLSTDVSTNYATKTELAPNEITLTRESDSSVGTNTNIHCYQIGKLVLFWGSLFVKSINANANKRCVNGFPTPAANFVTTGSGGYSSDVLTAIWVQSNGGLYIRPHTAISSTEVELYVSGAYITS